MCASPIMSSSTLTTKERAMSKSEYLIMSDPPLKTDDIDVVMYEANNGVEIYKRVMFVTYNDMISGERLVAPEC